MTSIETSLAWILELFHGPFATGLMVLAVAGLGMKMLAGGLSPRQFVPIILGCFLVVGASQLADRFASLPPRSVAVIVPPSAVNDRKELPPAADRERRAQSNPFSPHRAD